MNNYWLLRLKMLMVRFCHLGIDADIASVGLVEIWGVCFQLSLVVEN